MSSRFLAGRTSSAFCLICLVLLLATYEVNLSLAFYISPTRPTRWTAITRDSIHPSPLSQPEPAKGHKREFPCKLRLSAAAVSNNDIPANGLYLEAVASSGLNEAEAHGVLHAVASACDDLGLPFRTDRLRSASAPAVTTSVPGALGRVALLLVRGGSAPSGVVVVDGEWMESVQGALSERVDAFLHESSRQPLLIALRRSDDDDDIQLERDDAKLLSSIVDEVVAEYELREPLSTNERPLEGSEDVDDPSFVPSRHVEIDGAMVQKADSPSEVIWDTSTILVFDGLVDESLRRRLLDVVKGKDELENGPDDDWDDVENGPDPRRWCRGGLLDTPDWQEGEESSSDAPCWGLTDDAVMDICYNNHPSIAEFEAKLENLFPDFTVSRLPEAVLGASVSPLTANAPTAGDTFDYHIDADPNLAPPSPWTDVYGRYPNRSRGKPRFMSCLVYLSDEWDGERFGAPTRFLDPPTGETYDVTAQPGRCVIMDQDVSHTVVAPNETAGKRPRYSLVWKLILHPKLRGQDMKDLAGGRRRSWPKPTYVGSAATTDPTV